MSLMMSLASAAAQQGARRHRLWTPAQDGAAAWYDGAIYTAGSWTDLSGNGRHLTQATNTAQPTQVTRGGALALAADGGDWLRGAFGVSLPQPNTVFVVFERNDSDGGSDVLFDGDDNTNRHLLYTDTSNVWQMFGGAVIGSGTASNGVVYAGCFVFNGASSAGYINDWRDGHAAFSGNAGAAALDGLTVFAGYNNADTMVGWVWKLIVLPGAADAARRARYAEHFVATGPAGLAITT